ncbi:hypothetical protein ID866_9821 [Astraeus odoratus]|nr:hypothetical protein ID866_9821 [Astraeus odoratus]
MYLSVKQHISSLLFHDYFPAITIKPITPSWRKNITSYPFFGLSFSKIAFYTGLVKSTLCQFHHIIQPERPRLHGHHLSKLMPSNKQAVVHLIVNYKAKHAVLANQFINYISVSPAFTHAVRTSPREVSLKDVVKKKEPLLSSNPKNNRLALAFKYQFYCGKQEVFSVVYRPKVNRIGSDK